MSKTLCFLALICPGLLSLQAQTTMVSPSQFLDKGKIKIIRIDVGSPVPHTGSNGVAWDAERGFTGGETVTRPALPNLDEIYRTERVGDFSFSEAMPNGKYLVTLHFCETLRRSMDEAKGRRSFDALVENVRYNIKDLSREAGSVLKPFTKSFEVTVRDGTLNISLKSTPLNKADFDPACLSALEIEARHPNKVF